MRWPDLTKKTFAMLWHLRHWLQYSQLRTWIHDNLCYLTINCDTGQHLQFLRCFTITSQIYIWCLQRLRQIDLSGVNLSAVPGDLLALVNEHSLQSLVMFHCSLCLNLNSLQWSAMFPLSKSKINQWMVHQAISRLREVDLACTWLTKAQLSVLVTQVVFACLCLLSPGLQRPSCLSWLHRLLN